MMTTYLLLNIGIILFPLILSFEKKIRFYKKFPRVLSSILIVGVFYISWDVYAASVGHWGFSSNHSGLFYFWGLPVEEILFFITVPYAMLFLYEVYYYYAGKKIKNSLTPKILSGVLFLLFGAAAFIYREQAYTLLALGACGLFFLISFFYSENIEKISYWVFIIISYIPFYIVNYILTSLPVVFYNPDAIWDIRITTIPLEDFFYSFSMISFYVLIYNLLPGTVRVRE